ncbi:deoxyribose-phosphate aldolase [Pseudidiomarina insulisalsae]|uniref:Deoxyribose-phosphate aldolase n=1 Tax=Pseudidiomarina insulisalsae TaxID=575789 RepID=A0A432Y8Q6_9GAMM|nr:deoxyribose-phosphate aldolase [Pseudidiomarina insulisalsae]RUO57317.1 deoxyribose-phosphate aldolase [Pseudidiomarina insulisalsae]
MRQNDQAVARLALQLMDLTSLNQDDSTRSISNLCVSAATAFGPPAALCVFPEYVIWAKQESLRLGLPQLKIATVTNFPGGYPDIERAVAETERAVAAGADEVDVVFPYRAFMQGDSDLGQELISACKQACGEGALLKVILETGVLQERKLIRQASELAITAGADFIKTSTGKVATNATPEAAQVMLEAIRESGTNCGFKAAGGVRNVADAATYLHLAEDILGADFLTPARFRFGASGLLSNLVATLSGQDATTAGNSY